MKLSIRGWQPFGYGSFAGFTLLETLLCAALLTLVVFGVVGIYPGAMMSLRKGQDTLTASNLIEQVFEQNRAIAFRGVPGDGTPVVQPDVTANGIVFHTVVTGRRVNPTLKSLHAVVSWDSGAGAAAPGTLAGDTQLYDFTNP